MARLSQEHEPKRRPPLLKYSPMGPSLKESPRQVEAEGTAAWPKLSRGLCDGGLMMSVYSVIELIGTSTTSWEDAARTAVERAAGTLRELRVAQVVEQDLVITDGKVEAYRTKLNVSFKYEGNH
jgi:flavin-binding protein dodecin